MKYQLRKEFLSIRKSKNLDDLKISSNIITNECIQRINWTKIKIVSLYYPINHEVDILNIVHFLKSRGIIIALPVAEGFAVWNEAEELNTKKNGIREPLDNELIVPDLAIIPMICFDRRGYRIGYGSGFYDKVLSTMQGIIKIGVSYSFQETSYVPNEIHDIRLESIITEKEFVACI